jgi:MFS family permease
MATVSVESVASQVVPGRARRVATSAVLLGLVVSTFEGTVVTGAMPTLVSELGGEWLYGWVFSAFLLTSTVGVVIFGRLVDSWGRRPVFTLGMGLFLLGSVLCGFSHSVPQLIFFRLIQGLGAGAIQPTTLTLAGDLYSLEERARVQSLFTGASGAASVLGPLIGGYLVMHASWRWVFWVNVPVGVLAVALLLNSYRDPPRLQRRPDLLGPSLAGSSLALLSLAMERGPSTLMWRSIAGVWALALAGSFVFQQRRVVEPLLPRPLWQNQTVLSGLFGGLGAGAVLFSTSAYVPLWLSQHGQHSALVAGAALVPMLVGWSVGSTHGVKVLVRAGMRVSETVAFSVALVGALALTAVAWTSASLPWAWAALFVLGLGLGPAASSSTIGPQSCVEWSQRGVVTSMIYAMRLLGGALGVVCVGLAHGQAAAQFGLIALIALVSAGVQLANVPARLCRFVRMELNSPTCTR